MLDWCQNFDPATEHKYEIIFHSRQPFEKKLLIKNIHPPKFSNPANKITRVQLPAKKGIKTHFREMNQKRKSCISALQLGFKPAFTDISTQTHKLAIQTERAISKRKTPSIYTARQPSPTHRTDRVASFMVATPHFPDLDSTGGREEHKLDCYKLDSYKETKTTNGLVETSGQRMCFSNNVKNIQSYHVTADHLKVNSLAQQIVMVESSSKPRMLTEAVDLSRDYMGGPQHMYQHHNYSQKYIQILINVQSQIQLSEKNKPFNKFKLTPERRAILADRDTIISKEAIEPFDSDKSLKIEESMIVELQARSLFNQIGPCFASDGSTFCLGVEKKAHILISIRELPLSKMQQISEQILMHRQMQANKLRIEGVLELYQTQIDKNSFILIKQPHTEVFMPHLQRLAYMGEPIPIEDILTQISQIVYNMQNASFFLRREIKLQDLVLCHGQLKVERVTLFKIGFSHFAPLEAVFSNFKQLLQEYAR